MKTIHPVGIFKLWLLVIKYTLAVTTTMTTTFALQYNNEVLDWICSALSNCVDQG